MERRRLVRRSTAPGRPLLGIRLVQQRRDLFQRPNVIGDAGSHRRSPRVALLQRPMRAGEVVVHEVPTRRRVEQFGSAAPPPHSGRTTRWRPVPACPFNGIPSAEVVGIAQFPESVGKPQSLREGLYYVDEDRPFVFRSSAAGEAALGFACIERYRLSVPGGGLFAQRRRHFFSCRRRR